MPRIISSTVLRNDYSEVSRSCHEEPGPVFVTRNGSGDLAVMSIETYEALARRAQLVAALERGRADVEAGRTMPAAEAVSRLREEFS